MFILGLTSPPKSLVSYTHLMEFIPLKETLVSSRFLFFDGMVMVISSLLLYLFTDNTFYFVWISIVMNVLALCGFIYWEIPDSIKFLLEKNKISQAENALL
jgi:hypothetical protein